MNQTRRALERALCASALTLLIMLGATGCGGAGQQQGNAPAAGGGIPESSLIHAQELAQLMAGPDSTRPLLWHVGFQVLYRGGHIPGSRYIGPGSKPEGVEALRAALQELPPAQSLVLYCGCCPWEDCPNMKPAYALAREMGQSPRILYVAKNFQSDWVDLGLPSASGEQ